MVRSPRSGHLEPSRTAVAFILREASTRLLRMRFDTDAGSRSRGMTCPSYGLRSPREKREQGMPDARCTRGLVCNWVEDAHTSIQGSGEHPTFPAQWLDGLWRDHPGEFMAFVASVASRKPARRPGRANSTSARLDAYQFQASGPHAFAVRCSTARQHVPEPLTEFTRPAVQFRARCLSVHRNSRPNVR